MRRSECLSPLALLLLLFGGVGGTACNSESTGERWSDGDGLKMVASAGDDTACEDVEPFQPLNGYYHTTSVHMDAGSECDEFSDSSSIKPAGWEPYQIGIAESTPGSFGVEISPSYSTYPTAAFLTCLLFEDQTFSCVDTDLVFDPCREDGSVMVLVWSLSGKWTSNRDFEGTFTYDIQWQGESLEPTTCSSPCTTTWTFTAGA